MNDPHRSYADAVVRHVVDGPGSTSTSLRRAVFDRAAGRRSVLGDDSTSSSTPDVKIDALELWVDRVAADAWRSTDAEFDALGMGDDEVFEVTVAAAVGAGISRLDIGLGLLGDTLAGREVQVARDGPAKPFSLPAVAPLTGPVGEATSATTGGFPNSPSTTQQDSPRRAGMRIRSVERGRGPKAKVAFAVVRLASGYRAPDVIRTLMYRPKFFGAHHSRWTQSALRAASQWAIWEREIFAAFVSRLNQCVF